MGSGQCCWYAPNTFDQDDETIAIVTDPEGDPEDAIRTAVDSCPTQAISIAETPNNQPRGIERSSRLWPRPHPRPSGADKIAALPCGRLPRQRLPRVGGKLRRYVLPARERPSDRQVVTR